MPVTSSLRGVPLQAEQLAAAIARLQAMQDDGGQGKQSFDQGLQTQQNVMKAQNNTASNDSELKARIAKAKLSEAESNDALKDFMARPTYRQLWEQSQSMPARKTALPALNIGGIAGSGGYTNVLGGLLQ